MSGRWTEGPAEAEAETELAVGEWRRGWWLHPGLGVEEMPGKGRGVVALERLAPGTVIAQEWPLGAAIVAQPAVCAECGLASADGDATQRRCRDCGEIWCGLVCQARAEEHHWLECGQPTSLVGEPGSIFRMALRVYFVTPPRLRSVWDKSRKAVLQPPLHSALDTVDARLCLAASLPNHKTETRNMDGWKDIKRRAGILAGRIHDRLKAGPAPHFSKKKIKEQLLHILMVAYTNTFNIYRTLPSSGLGSTPARVVGSGFYPGVSLLNHSCLPNTTRHFDGTKMVMRAIRALENADICLLLIDAQTGVEAQDMSIFRLAQSRNKGLVILVNKWDLVSKSTNTARDVEKEIRERLAPFDDVPVVFISALEKQRIFKAIEVALEVHENRTRKIKTSLLNEVMLEAIEKGAGRGRGGGGGGGEEGAQRARD